MIQAECNINYFLAPGIYISLLSVFWQHLRHQIFSAADIKPVLLVDPSAILVN